VAKVLLLDTNGMSKYEYANNLLYILALMLLKGVHFLLQHATIMPKPKFYIPAVVTCGMVGFLFAASFECNAPHFWAIRSGKCFDQVRSEAENSADLTDRPVDSLLGCVRRVRHHHRSVLDDYPHSCHPVSANAERCKDKVTRSSRNAASVSITRPGQSYGVPTNRDRPIICAVSRLPLIHQAYTSRDYTIGSYRLAIPTQLQLHLAVVALSMGRIFHFLNTMNAGYLTSAINAPSRNATANRYVVSKAAQTSSHDKTSISESSKNLVPNNYGSSKTVVETVPMEDGSDWKRHTQGKEEDEQIQVTREYAVTYETKGTAL
jgi:hypothetical protein